MRQLMWLLSSLAVNAQEPPTYPSHPTVQACQNYKQDYMRFLNELRAQAERCARRSQNDPEYYKPENQTRILCSPVSWPSACAAEIQKRECAHSENFGALFGKCSLEAGEDTKDLSRQALVDSVVDWPRSGLRSALRLARTAADLKNDENLKSKVGSLEKLRDFYESWKRTKDIYDPKQAPEVRVKALGLQASKIVGRDPISKELTDTAIRAAVSSQKAAMDALVRETGRFSTQIAQSEERAIEQRKANEAAATQRNINAAQVKEKDLADLERNRAQANDADNETPTSFSHLDKLQYDACAPFSRTSLDQYWAMVAGSNGTKSNCFWWSGSKDVGYAIEQAYRDCANAGMSCHLVATSFGPSQWSGMINNNGGVPPGVSPAQNAPDFDPEFFNLTPPVPPTQQRPPTGTAGPTPVLPPVRAINPPAPWKRP
jgi:hypothetical protein